VAVGNDLCRLGHQVSHLRDAGNLEADEV
jgi:hypothetical protein